MVSSLFCNHLKMIAAAWMCPGSRATFYESLKFSYVSEQNTLFSDWMVKAKHGHTVDDARPECSDIPVTANSLLQLWPSPLCLTCAAFLISSIARMCVFECGSFPHFAQCWILAFWLMPSSDWILLCCHWTWPPSVPDYDTVWLFACLPQNKAVFFHQCVTPGSHPEIWQFPIYRWCVKHLHVQLFFVPELILIIAKWGSSFLKATGELSSCMNFCQTVIFKWMIKIYFQKGKRYSLQHIYVILLSCY